MPAWGQLTNARNVRERSNTLCFFSRADVGQTLDRKTFLSCASSTNSAQSRAVKVRIQFAAGYATGCTTGWSTRFEYSFDQTRHIVCCPHSRLAVTQ